MLWVNLLILLLLLLFLCPIPSLSFTLTTTSSHTNSHTRFIYAGCSQDKYSPNSPFQSNLLSFLSSLSSSSSQLSYNAFSLGNTTDSGSNSDSLFGLYQCRGDLRLHDCSHCISTASNQISLLCPSAFWASLQLDGHSLNFVTHFPHFL